MDEGGGGRAEGGGERAPRGGWDLERGKNEVHKYNFHTSSISLSPPPSTLSLPQSKGHSHTHTHTRTHAHAHTQLTRGVEGIAEVAGSSWGAGSGCSNPSSLPVLRCLRFNSECSSTEREGGRQGGRENLESRYENIITVCKHIHQMCINCDQNALLTFDLIF